MKKLILFAAAAILAAGAMQAQKPASELRIYLNPGHGNFGPNDRPMATIPYPMLPSTGRPDSAGFYESSTNLLRTLPMGEKLIKMGVKPENIMYSRTANGPYPYVANSPENDKYDRALSEICEEVDANNMDMFISIHSNAATDGGTSNYPLILYRGNDGEGGDSVANSRAMSIAMWGPHYMDELDPQSYYSRTSMNVRGDLSFYGSGPYWTTTSKGKFGGYLGVLRHGTPGFLIEGYFHTYQPARHRALNDDYCRQDAIRMSRGIAAYFNLPTETTGYIMGTVKDIHEKIVNNLFHYAPNTNDQWLPINGAKVNLLKNGAVVKSYDVDTLYNGIFVFEDLEPGEYTIQATADGYKAQGDYTKAATTSEYQGYVATSMAPFVVKANETTYAKVYLESASYVPPTVNYSNYPDPVQPTVAALPESFNFGQDDGTAYDVAGTVKRVIVRGDSTVILTNDGATPHLYLIDNATKKLIKEMSTTGIVPLDPKNAGDYSALNDIAFAADGQLIGVNSQQCQFGAAQVGTGYKRGIVRVYKWQDVDADPAVWVTTQSSNNFYNCAMGRTIAVSGPANGECHLQIAGTNDNGVFKGIRFLGLTVQDNVIVSSVFSEKTINGSSNYTAIKLGSDYQLMVSPQADDQWIVDGNATAPLEFKPTGIQNEDSPIIGRFPVAANDSATFVPANNGVFFKYAKHILFATPYMSGTNVAGLKLYDVTNGLANATLISTNGLDLTVASPAPAMKAAAAPATYMAAGATVKDANVILYLALDNKIVKFNTSGVDQPIVKGIYAYDLNYTQTADSYTLNFKVTENADNATVVLKPRTAGVPEITIPVGAVVTDGNQVTVDKSSLVLDTEYDWVVIVDNKAIPTVQPFFQTANTTARGVAMDLNPESDYFGNIYFSDPYGTKGIYAYTPTLTQINTEPYFSTEFSKGNTGSPFRMGVHPNGTVFIADWSDANAGLWEYNPADSQTLTNFFQGTPSSSGQITNAAGEGIGGSSTGVAFAGSGADLKLITFCEDVPAGNAGNMVCIYNIGENMTTSNVPDLTLPKASAKLINTNVNVVADEDGMWFSQIRGAGNNNTGVPSFIYVDYNDNILLNSGTMDTPAQQNVNGSWGAGLAVNADKTLLAVADGTPNIIVFDLTWDGATPVLSYKYKINYPSDSRGQHIINQMAFDPAGNLFAASRFQSYAFTMPKEAQQVTTPAASKWFLLVQAPTAVDNVTTAKVVESVQYVNTAGLISDKPFEGINIVITKFTDGTTKTAKVVK